MSLGCRSGVMEGCSHRGTNANLRFALSIHESIADAVIAGAMVPRAAAKVLAKALTLTPSASGSSSACAELDSALTRSAASSEALTRAAGRTCSRPSRSASCGSRGSRRTLYRTGGRNLYGAAGCSSGTPVGPAGGVPGVGLLDKVCSLLPKRTYGVNLEANLQDVNMNSWEVGKF